MLKLDGDKRKTVIITYVMHYRVRKKIFLECMVIADI